MNNLAVVESNNAIIRNDMKHPIRQFLEYQKKDKTQKEYERDVLQFFSYVYGDNYNCVEEVSKEDIEQIMPTQAQDYADYLCENNEHTTANRKISTLKNMYNYFINTYFSNVHGKVWLMGNPFGSIKIKVVDANINSYEAFTEDEVRKLLSIARLEDGLLYEMAVRTGVRLGALLGLGMSDIVVRDGMYCITGIDKGGKEFKNPITNEMYEKCKALSMRNEDSKIFSMSDKKANYWLKKYLGEIGVSENEIKERHLTFHSFKKSAVVFAGDYSGGDIRDMQEIGHHSNPEITLDIYNKGKKDMKQFVGLKFMLGDDVSDDDIRGKLDDMSKEELVEMIMGNGKWKNDMRGEMMREGM